MVSLHQFSTDAVVEATARCLKVINAELDVPYKLPPSMSARFRVGTSLATAVQVSMYMYLNSYNKIKQMKRISSTQYGIDIYPGN